MKNRTCLRCEEKKRIEEFFVDGIVHYWCHDCRLIDEEGEQEPAPTPDHREIVF